MEKRVRRKSRMISEVTREKIINAPVKLREKVLAGLFVNTGLRISDVTKLRIEEIDWDTKMIFKPSQEKTEPPVVAVLTDRMVSDIQTYILEVRRGRKTGYLFPSRKTSRSLSERQIKNLFDHICEEAKVENVTPHDLRATFFTLLGLEKAPPGMVSKTLGTSLKTIRDYYEKYSPEDVRKTFKRAQKE